MVVGGTRTGFEAQVRQFETVLDPEAIRGHHPFGQLAQTCFHCAIRRAVGPTQPNAQRGAAGETLDQYRLLPRQTLPRDCVDRIAGSIGPEPGKIVVTLTRASAVGLRRGAA